MAGIHALEADGRGAADDARAPWRTTRRIRSPSRILATALYLDDDPDGALAAWNSVGEPIIDLVNVTGLERTRYLVAARAMALHPQDLLTPAALRGGTAAARRAACGADDPRSAIGRARAGARRSMPCVLERPLFPTGPMPLAATACGRLTDRELAGAIASPSGGGELWTASWRWWEHRPRVAGGLAAPAPFGGVWRVEALGERQTYADGAAHHRGDRPARRRSR